MGCESLPLPLKNAIDTPVLIYNAGWVSPHPGGMGIVYSENFSQLSHFGLSADFSCWWTIGDYWFQMQPLSNIIVGYDWEEWWHSALDQAVQLGQDTLMLQCLSPSRCINGYRQP